MRCVSSLTSLRPSWGGRILCGFLVILQYRKQFRLSSPNIPLCCKHCRPSLGLQAL